MTSYVGTLHEISSENSTVALEQVKSFGTEGRDPENEIPPSDNIYEYIVFRGSDVKDLRIEKDPVQEPVKQPEVPDDPAILGVSPSNVLLLFVLHGSSNMEACSMMNYFGCKSHNILPRAQNRVDISVAFLLIHEYIQNSLLIYARCYEVSRLTTAMYRMLAQQELHQLPLLKSNNPRPQTIQV